MSKDHNRTFLLYNTEDNKLVLTPCDKDQLRGDSVTRTNLATYFDSPSAYAVYTTDVDLFAFLKAGCFMQPFRETKDSPSLGMIGSRLTADTWKIVYQIAQQFRMKKAVARNLSGRSFPVAVKQAVTAQKKVQKQKPSQPLISWDSYMETIEAGPLADKKYAAALDYYVDAIKANQLINDKIFIAAFSREGRPLLDVFHAVRLECDKRGVDFKVNPVLGMQYATMKWDGFNASHSEDGTANSERIVVLQRPQERHRVHQAAVAGRS